jgi:D-lactate dehydrogenase (cytochrome)
MDWAEKSERLRQIEGLDAVSEGESERRLHGDDLTFHAAGLPDVVAWPTDARAVSRVLELASAWGDPVIPFGAGSSVEGHIVAVRGGIALDLTRMDRILAVDQEALTATVQAGLTRLALERHVGPLGMRFTIDPGADATLGGMAATNAAGTMTVRFGKMRANVLALEAVLASGRVIRTGTAALKSSAGFDLTGLLVGSEGTLAVITELTLKLQPVPEHTIVIRASFPTTEAAVRAAVSAVAMGVLVTRLELLDELVVEAANAFSAAGLPRGGLLIAEVDGSAQAAEAEAALVREVFAEKGAVRIEADADPTERSRLWKVRHDVFFALKALAPGRASRATDTCVPISHLEGHTAHARQLLDELGLMGALLAHAGDGNLHVFLLFDLDDEGEMARVERFVDATIDDALARGGTCTSEHGIGIGKMDALRREHGDSLDLMRAVKHAFDPAGILNPGKILLDSETRDLDEKLRRTGERR